MIPYSRPKRSDLYTLSERKLLGNHTLHSGTLLYCPYMAVHPPPPPPPTGNGPTFLDFPLFLGIFQWDEPTKRVPFTAEPEIPEILTKWKTPYKDLTETGSRARKVSGTQGRDRGDKWKHKGTQGTEGTQVDTAWIRKTGQSL